MAETSAAGRPAPREPDFPSLAARLSRGDRRALARAISRVEAGDREARQVVRALPWPKRARVVALTGAPGVGKSLLSAGLLGELGKSGRKLAALAVDPTSPRTGGALLGDRARLAADDGAAFFRSMAARAGHAGLAPETPAVLRLLAAAGFDRILLETAGVGQGDHEVTQLADVTAALIAPGLGDSIQAAKAGLFEVADLVVVNQADRPGAEAMAGQWRAMRGPDAGPVLLASAKEGTGIGELAAVIERELAKRPGPAPAFRAASAAAPAQLPRTGRAGSPETLAQAARERLPPPGDPPNGKDPGADPDRAAPAAAFEAIRFHHVGIAAKDADAASSLFRELLGLRETARHRVEEFGVLALFLAPREAGAGRLEILEPTRTEGPVGRFLARRGPGLHHLCFEVPDIRAALKALAARGVRLVDREPRPGAGGHLVAFLHPSATAGVLVELKQAAEAPPPARDPPGRGPSPGKDAGRRRGPSAIPTGR